MKKKLIRRSMLGPGLMEAPKDAICDDVSCAVYYKPRFCSGKPELNSTTNKEPSAYCTSMLLTVAASNCDGRQRRSSRNQRRKPTTRGATSRIQLVPSNGDLQYFVPSSGRSLLAVCKRKHQSRRIGKVVDHQRLERNQRGPPRIPLSRRDQKFGRVACHVCHCFGCIVVHVKMAFDFPALL